MASGRRRAIAQCLGMISAQTLRGCRQGAFPDHALVKAGRTPPFQFADGGYQIVPSSSQPPRPDGVVRARGIGLTCASFFNLDVGLEQINQRSDIENERFDPFQHLLITSRENFDGGVVTPQMPRFGSPILPRLVRIRCRLGASSCVRKAQGGSRHFRMLADHSLVPRPEHKLGITPDSS